jgi:Aspartic acid proteinase inhibitor
MTKLHRLLAVSALFLGILVFGTSARAQDDPIVGGYGEMSVKSAEALRNARFAVSARARKTGQKIDFVKLVKAEQQVVAGMNFKLRMRVRVKGKVKTVTAVVYQNLRNKKSLTSWRIS